MTATVVSTAPQGSLEWMEARRQHLGGSDISAILGGINPWTTPLDVWLSKTEGDAGHSNEAMDWGHRLEPIVRERFAEDRPRHFVSEVPGILAHPDHPHMAASLDGLVEHPDGNSLLEIKTTRSAPWDELPQQYYLQVQHYLGVTGLDHAWLAALHSGSRYVEYEIHFDAVLWEQLVDYSTWWWNHHIVEGRMPDPDPIRDAPKLPTLWTPDPDLVIDADDDLQATLLQLRDAKAALAAAKTDVTELTGKVAGAMREATSITVAGELAATYKPRKASPVIDRAAMKADGVLDEYSRPGKPSRVLLLNRKWAQG